MKAQNFNDSDLLFYLVKLKFPKTFLSFWHLKSLAKKSSNSFDDLIAFRIFEFVINKGFFVKSYNDIFVSYPDIWIGEHDFKYHVVFSFSNGLYNFDNLDSEIEQIVGAKIYSVNLLSNGYIDYEFDFSPDDIKLFLKDSFDFQSFSGSRFSHKIRLSFKYEWDYLNCPHALVVGDTGSGKTYFLEQLLLEFFALKCDLYVADPKNSDLSIVCEHVDSRFVNFAFSSLGILGLLVKLEKVMDDRFEVIHRDGLKSFSDAYFPAFLIFDEFAAFSSLGGKEVKKVQNILKRLILKGRQAGVFVVVAMQKADATVLPTSIRDQLSLKIALGCVSTQGYVQVFGSSQGLVIQPRGEGYIFMNGMQSPSHIIIPEHSNYLTVLNGLGYI